MKLTKALQSLNLADTCEVAINQHFTVNICELARYNQMYQSRVAAFALTNPEHPIASLDEKARNAFFADVMGAKLTMHTLTYLTNVVMCGWSLKDDDGNDVPFCAETATEVFNTDQAGRVLAGKLLQAHLISSNFEVTIKN